MHTAKIGRIADLPHRGLHLAFSPDGRHLAVTIKNGHGFSELVECDGGSLVLSDALSDKSGAMTYRVPPGEDEAAPPQVILFSLPPAFRVSGGAAEVIIELLDKSAPALALALGGGTADMALGSERLAPGGLYRARLGELRATFAIDPLAEDEGGPLIDRLVFLEP